MIERASKPVGYEAVCRYLATGLVPASKELFSFGLGMERSRTFFTSIGNPQETFRAIHIAGTSGKSTVAYMLSSLLEAHGLTVGTHVSPHVYDIRERCQINARLISKQEFAALFTELFPHIEAMRPSAYGRPSYFEVTLAMTFILFKQRAVDYGVIETGLGGLYDATNTINRADKLAIITSLGLDHVEVLGHTLGEIARHKAGILPTSGHAVVLKPKNAAALAAIQNTARERHTDLEFVTATNYKVIRSDHTGTDFTYCSPAREIKHIRLSSPGEYQVINATLAIRALEYLAQRDGFTISPDSIRMALRSVVIPGRYDRVRVFNREVIFDGAHNRQKLGAFCEALSLSGIGTATWVLALKHSKDALAIMKTIKPKVSRLILTSYTSSQEGPAVQLPMGTTELARAAAQVGLTDGLQLEDNIRALKLACRQTPAEGPVIVAGSFYLLEDMYRQLQQQKLVQTLKDHRPKKVVAI